MRFVGPNVVAVMLLLFGSCERPPTPDSSPDAGEPSGRSPYGYRCENYVPPDFAPVATRICDGSDALRLGIAVPARPDRLEPGSHVLYDNGGSFLFVDGTCRYWVLGRNLLGAPTRTGVLDPASEASLAQRLQYDQWPRFVGEWVPQHDEITDVAPYVFTTGPGRDSAIICHDLCAEDVPQELDVLRCEFWAAVDAIYALGTEASGAAWFQLVERTHTQPVVQYLWPLSGLDPRALTVDPTRTDLNFGMAHFASQDDAEKLRALRRQFRQTGLGERILEIPVVDSEGRVYGLFMRDSVGHESASGMVYDW